MGFPILDVALKIIDKIIPDPVKKAEAVLELQKLEQAGDLAVMAGQVEINKIDAASSDKFQSRWRPFTGWVCGIALALQLVVAPMLEWGADLAGHPTKFPAMETELLGGLLISMLGLGGMRSFDKKQRTS